MNSKKKVVALILAFCFIFMMPLSSYANEEHKILPYADEWVTQEEVMASYAEIIEYIKRGEEIRKTAKETKANSYKTLSISALYQDSGSWANSVMPCGHSNHKYKDVGCAMTAYAMALNYYSAGNTPVTVATTYQNNHGNCCNFNSGLLVSDYPGRTRTISTGHSSSTFNNVLSAIVGAINADYPVVVKLVRPNGGTHFVTCYGYEIIGSNTYVYIRDPLYNGGKTSLNNYASSSVYPSSYSIIK